MRVLVYFTIPSEPTCSLSAPLTYVCDTQHLGFCLNFGDFHRPPVANVRHVTGDFRTDVRAAAEAACVEIEFLICLLNPFLLMWRGLNLSRFFLLVSYHPPRACFLLHSVAEIYPTFSTPVLMWCVPLTSASAAPSHCLADCSGPFSRSPFLLPVLFFWWNFSDFQMQR